MGTLEAAWYRGAVWLWLLRPLEWLYRILTALRRGAYGRGLIRAYRCDRPLVIVGNITVGGTGKTPVVIALVEALKQRGLRPGVVSRGYGATAHISAFPHQVSLSSNASDCGDEPLLIYRRTGVPVVVAPRRAEAIKALLANADIDVVISDDGLQHYAMARDLEIAVIDAERGLGNGFCLPAGPLREPQSRLKTVDRVIYRGGDVSDSSVTYQPQCWVNVSSGAMRPLDSFVDAATLAAIAGIGQPQQFFDTLTDLSIAAAQTVFPDHHDYSAEDFASLEGQTVLMTEKDAVKCASLAGDDAWFLRIDAVLPQSLIERVAELAQR
ncbi:tetraacyldisaccharide 4'-kinase [Halioglobus sp. HI00S01]|uniref:tetraacyldisaccharide 4'-kinase n=1 Tax=Halioglobus sp. HI00S01 TaxID=1822214 RepID=UPI0007C20151|nr:tetraacyldisaccharide 4'-kinase [Halioglobus sp. HI00S01]KZX60228.1 tetraacyldisaccharide 4'-kinase [Halioglobus sp. HI00S01]